MVYDSIGQKVKVGTFICYTVRGSCFATITPAIVDQIDEHNKRVKVIPIRTKFNHKTQEYDTKAEKPVYLQLHPRNILASALVSTPPLYLQIPLYGKELSNGVVITSGFFNEE